MEYGFKLDDYALIYKITYNVMSFFLRNKSYELK